MFCKKCGASYNEGSNFCPECGNRINSAIYNSMTDNVIINKNTAETSYYQEHILSSWKTNPLRKFSNRLKLESILNLIIAIILALQISLAISILTDIIADGFQKGFNDVIEIYTYNGEIHKVPDFIDDFNISLPSMGTYKYEFSISLSIAILVLIILLTMIYCIIKFKSFKNSFKYSQIILSNPLDITNTAKKDRKRIKLKFTILFVINIIFLLMFSIPNSNFIPYAMTFFLPFIISHILSFVSLIINTINIKYVLNNDVVFNEIEQKHLKNQSKK